MKAALAPSPPMRTLVERALEQVPPGRVTTYGDIARALGDIKAARAVGEILSTNQDPAKVPCHRVVMADGSMGGYAFGGAPAKRKRLASEGVPLSGGAVLDIEANAVHDFDLPDIFATFARRQSEMAGHVSDGPLPWRPKVAIGLDASYDSAGERGFAAAVAVDLNTRETFAEAVVEFRPPAPYVPGYLAMREVDGVVAAARQLPAEAHRRAVVVSDGQGILHPRRCGIASMAGLELALPALGAAKKKLTGDVDAKPKAVGEFEVRKVKLDREVRGAELRPVARAGPWLYVSPGTGMSVTEAAKLAADLTAPGDESPLPVKLADALSRKARAAGAA